MKILICGFTKIKYMPYLNFYLGGIDKNAELHLLYWNRDEKDEDLSDIKATFHEFKKFQLDDCSKFSKIGNFINYKKFANKTIDEVAPDRIIVLHSLPAVLLKNTLIKKYKNKYIFDYRDYTYEGFGLFADAVKTLVQNSYRTFVSSDGFRKYLPASEKILTSHNIDVKSSDIKIEKTESDKIRLGFWGFIRDYETNEKLIRLISKDNRYELHYYGREQTVANKLKAFANNIQAENVFFHGEYKPCDRYRFAENTDIIHNFYDYTGARMAMGNKYYDGVTMRIPQVLNVGTFMGEAAEKAAVGICLSLDDNFLDKLFQYYVSLDRAEFEQNCNKEYERIMTEYNNGLKTIEDFSLI